jgi:hypothetical protein
MTPNRSPVSRHAFTLHSPDGRALYSPSNWISAMRACLRAASTERDSFAHARKHQQRAVSQSVRERVVETAQAMLDSQLSLLAGARTLVTLRSELGAGDDADFSIFVVIESGTDELPIGRVRQYWDKTALERLQPEIQAAEAWAKTHGKDACASLIRRYGNK